MSASDNSHIQPTEYRSAYDPAENPEFFEGIRTRRIFAFLIDAIIISVPILLAAVAILILGIVTLGLGFILFWPLQAGAVVWAVLYYGLTLGSGASATIGMRVMEIEMRTWYGAPGYFVLGAVHAIGFWLSISFFTPLILVVSLFNTRKRLLHDILLGTVVINSAVRASRLSRS